VVKITSKEKIITSFKGRHVISIRDFKKEELDLILDQAEILEKIPRAEKCKILDGYHLGIIFYEPSTRTKISFTRAADTLGMKWEGIADPKTSSASKGETLRDTVRNLVGYEFDALVIRHNDDGSVRRASEYSHYPNKHLEFPGEPIPILNGGDGSNQHPTQTMLDLYTIKESQGTMDSLTYLFHNDLKNGRTIHSLAEALLLYQPKKVYFCSSSRLKMPRHIISKYKKSDIEFEEVSRYEDVLPEVDILYDTRPQLERENFTDDLKERIKSMYRIRAHTIKEKAKESMKIMHPLPRNQNLMSPEEECDDLPQAYYFKQAHNGLFVRQALLCLVKGVSF
jgi:aspartate carbamoyltransferase catalytic subunit